MAESYREKSGKPAKLMGPVTVTTSPKQTTDPILWREKNAFFWANAASVPVMATVNSFLLIFYTDVVGLNPAAVGTLFLIARILDGLSDPIVGYVVDHLPYTRWGRFRPYLVLASLVCALNFVLLWLGPSMAPSGKLLIAYITYLALGITFPFMDLPLGALLPAMTADSAERNSISGIKGIAFLLVYTAVSALTIPLVNRFESPVEGWQTTMIIYAILIVIITALGTWGVKERVLPKRDERYAFRDLYTILFNTRPLGVILLSTIAVNIGVGLSGGTAIFYYTYNLGNVDYFSLSGIVTLPAVLLGVVIFHTFGNRFEKRNFMVLLLGLAAAGVGMRSFLPYTSLFWIMVSVFISAVGTGGAIPLIFSMIGDSVDYTEWKHGYRAEGAVAAVQTFTQKTGLGLGGAIPGYVLAFTGYRANVEQTDLALYGILLTTTTIPFAFYLLSALIFRAYPVDSAMLARIKHELASD
ncbi:MAG: sugar (glycoside-pentoside-hexuronide) transporter [Cellvibrionaceae bacterium]